MSTEPITYIIKKPKKKHRILNLFIGLLKTILVLIVLFLIGVIITETLVFLYLKNIQESVIEDFEKLTIGLNSNYANSIIVDISGEKLATLNGDEKRQIITLEEMSPYLPKAYVAIEDERFFEHRGVDLKRTGNAIYTYLRNKGTSSFGGSSITQQLVKNITNDREDSINRKVKEWILAYQLEQSVDKYKILEKYLNIIFVGSDVYGTELGAQYYFNKSAQDLSLSESAFLAGITHSPNQYNPFNNTDNSNMIKNRTKTVLRKNV